MKSTKKLVNRSNWSFQYKKGAQKPTRRFRKKEEETYNMEL